MTRCTICLDPRVQAVDSLLAEGRSARSLAAEFGLPPESLKRHARAHVAKRETVAKPPSTADPLAELVDVLRGRALNGSDPSVAREYRLALAALTDKSAAPPAYDVLADPEWLRLRTILLEVLEQFPPARQAVADALRVVLG